MAKITFIQPDGSEQVVDGDPGMTVMETAKKNLVAGIEAECGGACSCATCHVYVDEAWREKIGPPSEMEEDMLDFAFDVRPSSRLSCQIKVTEALDGLIVQRARKAVLGIPAGRGRYPSGPPQRRQDILGRGRPKYGGRERGSCALKCYLALLLSLAVGASAMAAAGRRTAAAMGRHRSQQRGLLAGGLGRDRGRGAPARRRGLQAPVQDLRQRPRRHRRPEGGVRGHVLRAAARRAAPPRPRPTGARPLRTRRRCSPMPAMRLLRAALYVRPAPARSSRRGRTPCAARATGSDPLRERCDRLPGRGKGSERV